MRNKFLILIFLFVLKTGWTQTENKFQGQMFSADVNMGYNLARIETNYWFEEKMPYSFQLNWHRSNYENQKNLNLFGYSDFGATFLYHDFRDEELGKNYGLYAFMEYYLWHPSHRLQGSFRLSQGIAYNTNPYNRNSNSKNKLFGSHLLFPIDVALYFKYPKIMGHWGLQMGIAIFHYSNGYLESPNYGANIPSITLGLNYDFRSKEVLPEKQIPDYEKKWQFLAFLRFGINESIYYDSGQYPFFVPGLQVEKHLSFRHKINFGTELYLSYFLREQIRYEYYSIPEYQLEKIYDFKRIGIFVEHEFFYQKFGINMGVGYHIYSPYPYRSKIYNRFGTKYYLGKHWIGLFSLKVYDINNAEAMEFGLMYRI